MTNVLVTGSAGFIGFHVAKRLLEDGINVIGVDNLNDYYDVNLKIARNAILQSMPGYRFEQLDICDYAGLKRVCERGISKICHLAAQAGVRYSIENPFVYQRSNNEGFLNVLECARHFGIKQFIYASSSSVYGGNHKVPFSEKDNVDDPISLYAATKRSNELVARAYSHLYTIKAIGLRFFTVYGPWGRPDMAYFSFTRAIFAGEPIEVYNQGKMKRDFTYIDDIVSGVLASLDYSGDSEIFNFGNDHREELLDLIACLENCIGKKAQLKMLPLQPGDVVETWADISSARKELGFKPQTRMPDGIKRFVDWYRTYYCS